MGLGEFIDSGNISPSERATAGKVCVLCVASVPVDKTCEYVYHEYLYHTKDCLVIVLYTKECKENKFFLIRAQNILCIMRTIYMLVPKTIKVCIAIDLLQCSCDLA